MLGKSRKRLGSQNDHMSRMLFSTVDLVILLLRDISILNVTKFEVHLLSKQNSKKAAHIDTFGENLG